jgi:hypothetical protein
MEHETLEKICEKIYKRFPEVHNKKPSVKEQPNGQYLLIFRGKGTTPDGHTIPRTVRVVASNSGKIIKTSTSR